MDVAKTLKLDIIELLIQTENIPVLVTVKDQLRYSKSKPLSPNVMDAAVEIKSAPSLASVMESQQYKPISFEDYRKKVDDIEWEHSIDELLILLD